MIELWTDGSSAGKRGTPGGWCAILVSESGLRIAYTGYEASTSNNRMELFAVVQGLERLGSRTCQVCVFTDSAYTKNAFTQGWIRGWKQNGWISSKGDPVANRDLWDQLIRLCDKHVVTWQKVKGHTKSHEKRFRELNHLADKLAVQARVLQMDGVQFLD